MDANAFRSYLKGAPNTIWYDYNRHGGMPMTIDRTAGPQQPQQDQAPWGLQRPNPYQSFLPQGDAGTVGIGQSGVGGTPGIGVSASPSSVAGTGMSSIANNIGIGGTQGTIAALMGLAGLAAPAPVGMIAGIPGMMSTLGVQGLMNLGVAVTNDQSSNNVANDVAAISAAMDAMGIGENSAGPVGEDAANSSPGANAPSAATVGANVDGMAVDAATAAAAAAASGADGAAAANAANAGESGADYARGGRAYQRFKTGGPSRPRGAIKNPVRNPYPELWDDPRKIAQDAAARTAPEDPSMKQLWGLDRGDMYELFKDRKGTVSGSSIIEMPTRGRGAEAAHNVMTPRNAQRLQDTLAEGEKYAPELSRGMQVWYPYLGPPQSNYRGPRQGVHALQHLHRRVVTTIGGAARGVPRHHRQRAR
jgi:hypothetical protein